MEAVELIGFEGLDSLRVVEAQKPRPGDEEILIEVRAAGINFAELEMIKGRYPAGRKPPFVMGFEAAGVVAEVGSRVGRLKAGDPVAAIVSSGGCAQYATAHAGGAIPIPDGVSFAEATTIPVNGLTAYALVHLAANVQRGQNVLIQSGAGGVGLYLVQLARLAGAGKIVAMASSKAKLELLLGLGVDHAIDYGDEQWPDRVREVVGQGVDVVFEAAAGKTGEQSMMLAGPAGRIVVFGARSIHEAIPAHIVRQLIQQNQTLIGFNLPSFPREHLSRVIPPLLHLIETGALKLFAPSAFALRDVKKAYAALASRQTIGKVVLIP